MLKKNPVDARAVKLLCKYDLLAESTASSGRPLTAWQQEYNKKHQMSADDLAYIKRQGLAFDPVSMKHDEAVQLCFEAAALCKKRHVSDLFVAGLGGGRPDYRAGLSALAIMQSMPDHPYEETPAGFCRTCGAPKFREYLDLTALNKARFEVGALFMQRSPYEVQFFLRQHAQLEPVEPRKEDVDVLASIIQCLDTQDADAKPTNVAKELRKLPSLKVSVDQARGLLETFGLASVLESADHPGYLTQYTNPGLAPSKSHASDWAYPVDFWTGKDRVNRTALAYWFAEHKGLLA